jgi:O-antigen/teichoic acid export membrane protein
MPLDQPGARIGYRGGVASRARQLASKALLVLGGTLMLASAFALSLVFLAIGLAVVLTVGGYLWWQTRDLRKQLRERMQTAPAGRVIEGEVISRDQTRR